MRRSYVRQVYSYTLIELLVTIAIMIILASLLFPGLRSAREKSLQIACASNLKQLGLAFMMYANDNHGHLGGFDTRPGNRFLWIDLLVRGDYITGKTVREGNPFICPSNPKMDHTYDNIKFNYATNWRLETIKVSVLADGTSMMYMCRLSDIKDGPAQTLLALDESCNFYFHICEVVPERIAWVHKNGANQLFCDGHVTWHSYGGDLLTSRPYTPAAGD